MKIVKFSILVEISEGLKKLWFESMYLKLSNGKSRFSIICLRKKKGMFVLKNPSGAPLRGVLTCASLFRISYLFRARARVFWNLHGEQNRNTNWIALKFKIPIFRKNHNVLKIDNYGNVSSMFLMLRYGLWRLFMHRWGFLTHVLTKYWPNVDCTITF